MREGIRALCALSLLGCGVVGLLCPQAIGAGVAGIVIDGYSAEALLWATAVLTVAGVAVLPRRAVAAAAESDVPEIIPGTEDGHQSVKRA
ncbi:hypothetical protein ACQUSY_12075 [Microbacterium sp. YY-03]|uniref:hypothetical protein n=1 Tax=Microbacterium sp. YY-03 TaxID=3421636 RepID=UPI003D180339